MVRDIQIWTEFDVAGSIGIPARTVLKEARSGRMGYVDLPGGRVGFMKSDVERYIEQNHREPMEAK